MLLRPLKKRINDCSNGTGWDGSPSGLCHQGMKLLKSSFSIGAQVVTFAVNRDEPGFSILAWGYGP